MDLATAHPQGGTGRRRPPVLGRIARLLVVCPHEGAMTHVQTIGAGVEVWHCVSCGRDVVVTDA